MKVARSLSESLLMWDSSADESEKPLHPEIVTGPLESREPLFINLLLTSQR